MKFINDHTFCKKIKHATVICKVLVYHTQQAGYLTYYYTNIAMCCYFKFEQVCEDTIPSGGLRKISFVESHSIGPDTVIATGSDQMMPAQSLLSSLSLSISHCHNTSLV